MVGNCENEKLKDIKLVKEGGSYYLDATYEYENEHGVYELNIPKIHLPIMTDRLSFYCRSGYSYSLCPDTRIDLGFGELAALRDFETGMTHKITEIKKKTQKMTVAEIEAALGYKVEIVSK